jgi:hypothetical protein
MVSDLLRSPRRIVYDLPAEPAETDARSQGRLRGTRAGRRAGADPFAGRPGMRRYRDTAMTIMLSGVATEMLDRSFSE